MKAAHREALRSSRREADAAFQRRTAWWVTGSSAVMVACNAVVGEGAVRTVSVAALVLTGAMLLLVPLVRRRKRGPETDPR